MTGYHLSVGYNSGHSCKLSPDEAWAAMKQAASELCADKPAIIAEARAFGAPETCKDGCCSIGNHAEHYNLPCDDLTIRVDQDNRQIVQLASGDREIKEHVRRAFCRLLIQRMHRLGVEVNMTVG